MPTEPDALSNAPPGAASNAGLAGGSLHFTWLSPLDSYTSSGGPAGPEGTSVGVFDGTLSPVVFVCEYDDAFDRCGKDVAKFTTTETRSPVRVVPEEELYVVNWHTNKSSLDEGHYQIIVSVGGDRLGLADLYIVPGGSELSAIDTEQYFALKNGRTLPIRFRIVRVPVVPPVDLHLIFTTQPSETQSGAAIEPAVQVSVTDGAGYPYDGTVSLELAPNYCGATLSGTTSVASQDGVATFSDLSIDMLGGGYVLIASAETVAAGSAAFDVASAVTGETLTQETTVCITPTAHHDASALAYVPRDDALWFADDNYGGAIEGIDRVSGAVLKSIPQSQFLAAFPDAALCDDGDGDPTTSCSYVNEFEIVAYDQVRESLYLINTVNNPNLDPPVDKPAIFRLVARGCHSCFAFDAWRALPEGFAYNAAVVVGGELFLADVRKLYRYDFDTNVLDTSEPILTAAARIRGLSYDGSYLWVLTRTGVPSGGLQRIAKIDWATGQEVGPSHSLDPFGVPDFAGIEVVDEAIYALDGTPLNPIYVFREAAGGN